MSGYDLWDDFGALDKWLADHGPGDPKRPIVERWIKTLVADPDGVGGTPVPNATIPTLSATVPGADVTVTFTIVRPPDFPGYNAVVLMHFRDFD